MLMNPDVDFGKSTVFPHVDDDDSPFCLVDIKVGSKNSSCKCSSTLSYQVSKVFDSKSLRS